MKPSHPGALLKEMIIGLKEESGKDYSVGDIADNLGITRKTLSFILNEKQSVSIKMALRLSKAFGTTAQFWINVQRNYDLWEAEKRIDLKSVGQLV